MVTTIVELPTETDQQVRGLAERTGRRPDEVIRDLIRDGLARELDDRPQPWPKSIGSGSDGGVDATEFEDWLAENWKLD